MVVSLCFCSGVVVRLSWCLCVGCGFVFMVVCWYLCVLWCACVFAVGWLCFCVGAVGVFVRSNV